MVEATLVAGASIARVARAYGVNANQLFHWRKLYKEGLLEERGAPRLLPVSVPEIPSDAAAPQTTTTIERNEQDGIVRSIRIAIAGKACVTIEAFDDRALRTVLEYVLR
jgi:transposase